MAGKKPTAPAQVYVVVSGHHNGIDATIQGVYVDYDAASMASNNNSDLVHVLAVNYNGVDGEPAETANSEASAKVKTKTKAAKAEKSSTSETTTKANSKKKSVPDGTPGSLVGEIIALTGALRTLDHATFEQTVEKFGGTFTKKFAGSTSIVLGEKPGPTKVEEITKEGYRTITEEEFYDRIEAEFAPPAKRAKKE